MVTRRIPYTVVNCKQTSNRTMLIHQTGKENSWVNPIKKNMSNVLKIDNTELISTFYFIAGFIFAIDTYFTKEKKIFVNNFHLSN